MLQVKGCVDWIFAWVETCDAIFAAAGSPCRERGEDFRLGVVFWSRPEIIRISSRWGLWAIDNAPRDSPRCEWDAPSEQRIAADHRKFRIVVAERSQTCILDYDL